MSNTVLYPDKKNTIALLKTWEDKSDDVDKLWTSCEESIGVDPNGKLCKVLFDLLEQYTNTLEKLLGSGDWLNWYAMDNDMGRLGMSAGHDGKTKQIKSLSDLYELIVESRKRVL